MNLNKIISAIFCDDCHKHVDFTSKKVTRTFNIKGTVIEIDVDTDFCNECQGILTTPESLKKTLAIAKSKYEEINAYNPGFLKDTRKKLNLNQTLFSKLLSIGEATVKRYELGKTGPSKQTLETYKRLNADSSYAVTLFENIKTELTTEEKEEIYQKLYEAGLYEKTKYQELQDNYAIDTSNPIYTKLTSYEKQIKFSAQKTIALIQYFSRQGVLKTKLMKLLWYSDFLMYKQFNQSITGLIYTHRQYGPVPYQHTFLLGCATKEKFIKIDEEETEQGYLKSIVKSINFADSEKIFSDDEIMIINHIEKTFKDYTSSEISYKSHQEDGWKNTADRELISYEYSKTLSLQL